LNGLMAAGFLFQPKNTYATIIPFPAIQSSGTGNIVEEEIILRNIAAFDGVPLLSLEKLADAWPQEYQASYEKSQKNGSNASEGIASAVIPSLVELSRGGSCSD
jgi:hypothetical protein